jgi:hypothetical protein
MSYLCSKKDEANKSSVSNYSCILCIHIN